MERGGDEGERLAKAQMGNGVSHSLVWRPHMKGTPPVIAASDDVVVGLLRSINDRLGVLVELQRRQAVAPLADRFLAAVFATLETEPFTAVDLLALARTPLSTRTELRAVVEDVVRGDLDQGGAGRRLGRFLRANGQVRSEGLVLVSLGKRRDRYVYKIERATETVAAWNL